MLVIMIVSEQKRGGDLKCIMFERERNKAIVCVRVRVQKTQDTKINSFLKLIKKNSYTSNVSTIKIFLIQTKQKANNKSV